MSAYFPMVSNACKLVAQAMVFGGGVGAITSAVSKKNWDDKGLQKDETTNKDVAKNADDNEIGRIKTISSAQNFFKEIHALSDNGLTAALGTTMVYLGARIVGVIDSSIVGQYAYKFSQLVLKANQLCVIGSIAVWVFAFLHDAFVVRNPISDQIKVTSVYTGTMIYPALVGSAGLLIIDKVLGK